MEVNIQQPEGTTRVMIPLDIPTTLIEQGAVDLYAIKTCGWCPKVTVDGVEQDNPIDAITTAAERIRTMVKEEYKSIAEDIAIQQAKAQVNEQFNQLFGENV